MTEERKAWRIEVDGFDESFVHATTRAAARYRAFAAILDAGYRYTFGDIRVRRAPEYDNLGDIIVRPCTREYAEHCAAAIRAKG